MDRPPRLPPPAGALFSGEGRPERPLPPPHSSSSFSKTNPYDEASSSSIPLPTLSYPNEGPSRVQFSDPSPPPDSSRNFLQPSHDAPGGGFSAGAVARKRSLVRPDRARLDENDRLWNYRNHAAAMEAEGRGVAAVSRTGHYATAGLSHDPAFQDVTNLRRGRSILAREEGEANETGLSMFKRGATLRRPTNRKGTTAMAGGAYEKGQAAKAKAKREPLGPWMIFCLALTVCCPSPLLKCFGEFATEGSKRARSGRANGECMQAYERRNGRAPGARRWASSPSSDSAWPPSDTSRSASPSQSAARPRTATSRARSAPDP